MRTGAAQGYQGYYHEAVCYSSDDELLDVVVPFLTEGLKVGEPTIVALGERNAALVSSAMADPAGLAYLSGPVYNRPPGAIASYQKLLAQHVAAGAGQIRIIGEFAPAAFDPAVWHWWARYESAINLAFDDYPLWSMCAYDTRSTPSYVMSDVLCTHPRMATAGGLHPEIPQYQPPASFLARPRPVRHDPLLASAPLIELTDPVLEAARAAVSKVSPPGISPNSVDDLTVAVNEAVTNAMRHGKGPVHVRYRAAADRVIVSVSDQGNGPPDPLAGLVAPKVPIGGLGLWLMHQLCDYVLLDHTPEGFSVHLTVGVPR
jgi:anti-sigma regulatory factor (Ser/Thr protein kinase)